ncbi:MAG: HAMP domain-containing histidine kinase [Chlorobi bacterium]|nr:HAMP domain-containing histidine kinase [Chlorobiota bacterium]
MFSQNEIIPGLPFVTNYRFETYNASPQNWDITQADNGILYIANGNGILVFDGARWNLIELPNKTIARSIDISDNGIVYVGGYDEFGYLKTNESGLSEYVSLINKLPVNIGSFHDVWTTRVINNKVFFQTFYSIFIYEADTIREVKSDKEFIWSFKKDNTYFTQNEFSDLMIFKDNKFQKINGSYRFYNDFIYALLNYPDNKSLIVSSKGDLFICSIDTNLLKLEIEDSIVNETRDFLHEYYFYSGINYTEDKIGFGTFYGGFLLIDQYGNPLMNMNKTFGLRDNNIRNIFKDKSNNIWLATDRGISYIDMNLSLTIFNESSNISGNVNAAIIYDNPTDNIPKRLYIATIDRIYYKNLYPAKNDNDLIKNFQKFKPYGSMRSETWNFYSYKNTLLCATSFGVYELKNNTAYLVSELPSWSFTPVKNKPDLVLVNLNNGLNLIEFNNGNWSYKWKIKDFDEYVSTSVFDDDGYLWTESVNHGIYKLKLSDNYKRVELKETYTKESGLPSNTLNLPYKLGRQIKFVTEKGVYNFNKKRDRFYPDTNLNALLGEKPLDYIYQDSNKNIWFFSTVTKTLGELLYNKDGSYTKDTSRFNEVKKLTIWNMYYYNDSNVFFCSPNGLILYNKNKRPNTKPEFKTLLRKIEIINNPDSIININPNAGIKKIVTLSYKQNALKFSYAIPYFENVDNNQYSYYLKGFDNDWSPWTTKTEKEYTFLREGTYTFFVKSRNSLMSKGKAAIFQFKITPPFYRTWIAYFLYVCSVFFLVYRIIMFKVRLLKRANLNLERKIEERTSEIKKQNKELYEHKEYILKQRDDLTVLNANKDRFFSIISHDLRSPFNTILGFSELLMQNLNNRHTDENYEYAKIINDSAASTFELLENLLTWSKIQGNNVKYQPEELRILDVINECIAKLKHIAEAKNIVLYNNYNEDTLIVYADVEMLKTVIRNLISNAIKFSEPRSTITINANESGNNVVVSVNDEGVGISEEHKKHLFKIEKNITTPGTAKEKGSGLGLILCNEFVKINKGTIWVKSTEGEGSTFFISLPQKQVF